MTDFERLLRKAQTVEDRARILKKELSGKKEDIEKFNGGLVLEIGEYEGLRIGDKVQYTNALGQSAEGYINHFFMRLQETRGLRVAEMCKQHLAKAGGRPYEKQEQPIIPVIIPVGGSGYSTHNGFGLPQKLS